MTDRDLGGSAVGAWRALEAGSKETVGRELLRRATEAPGRPLGAARRAPVEHLLGVDLSDVVVHDGPNSDAALRAADADAMTSRAHILLGSQDAPLMTPRSQRLLNHELAHAARWKTSPGPGAPLLAGAPQHEADADAVAAMANDAHSAVAPAGSEQAGSHPAGPAPGGPGPANARQQSKSTTSPTERDMITAMETMRRRNPAQFVSFVLKNEAAVFTLLGPFGFRGCWDKPDAYLDDYDAAIGHWLQRGNIFNLYEMNAFNLAQEEKKDQEVGLWALPDGSGFVGTRKQYRGVQTRLYWERQARTGKNIAGGIFGAVGYMFGGDEGSDLGANVDAVAGAAAGVAERRAYNQSLNTPAGRPIAGEVRPLTDSGKKARPSVTPTTNTPGTTAKVPPTQLPVSPPKVLTPVTPAQTPKVVTPEVPVQVPNNGTSTATPKVQSPVVPAAKTPTKTTSTATQTSAKESWSEWSPLIKSAGNPTPRKSDNGFRTETRVDKEGRYQVVVTEGVIGPPAKSKSTAPYGEALEGEHSTHPIGRQLGEDVGPHAQGSGPSDLNLSGLKKVENRLRAIHEIATEQGASVSTRTTTVTELRKSGDRVVPLLIGVRREAWLRMPGTDKETPILRYEATVDPVTRVATETEVVWGSAAKTTE